MALTQLNQRVMKLAWVLTGAGLALAWVIDRWLEPVSRGALPLLASAALILLPATAWVWRAPPRSGAWVAYFSLVGVITVANLAFANPDLWTLFFVLGVLRLVYKDSYLHLFAPPLSTALYALVWFLNPGLREQLTGGQFVVRLFILLCFHAMTYVINLSLGDIRARPARTVLRLLGQYAIRGVRRRRRPQSLQS